MTAYNALTAEQKALVANDSVLAAAEAKYAKLKAALDILFGDVDRDGSVTSSDARLALRAAVGLENYEKDSYAFLAGDVDFDGTVPAGDARMVLRAAVQLEDPNVWLKAYSQMQKA